MKGTTRSASGWIVSAIAAVLVGWCATFPSNAGAQTQGNNDVYSNSSGSENGSSAFIDASMFAISTDTICSTIYKILQPGSYSVQSLTRAVSPAPRARACLVFDKEGRLYGTTIGGFGSEDDGTVFEFAPPTNGNLPLEGNPAGDICQRV
jgi:hypothetical protein